MRLFRNRLEAATELAGHLAYLRAQSPVVLGLANDGVPLAETIARALDAPLDVMLLESLCAPGTDQVVGAVDETGHISMIESSARWHHLSSQEMIGPAREAFRRIQRRRGRLRAILPQTEIANRPVIIVDQVVEAGARMLGAVASLRDRGARTVIAAAPVGASKVTWQLHEIADAVVIPHQPAHFDGTASFFEEYAAVSDELMLAIVQKWVSSHPVEQIGPRTVAMKLIKEDGHILSCEIDLPPGTQRGSGPFPAVIFAHGFESDARSPRSVPISQRLAKRGVIGVRLDFTGHGRSEGRAEDATDVQMIRDLRLAHQQALRLQEVDGGRIGVNGSGTGAPIALHYAAAHTEIKALVIRGPVCGNEMETARRISAPTLIIHGERDTALAESVETIDHELSVSHRLLRIPDSSRLFNDPISRQLMIDASVNWFVDHLAAQVPASALHPGSVEPGSS